MAPESHSRWAPNRSQGRPNAPESFPSWHLQATRQATLALECYSRWAPSRSQGGPNVQKHCPHGFHKRQGKQPKPWDDTLGGSQAGPEEVLRKSQCSKALPSWHLQATGQAALDPECHCRWVPSQSQGGGSQIGPKRVSRGPKRPRHFTLRGIYGRAQFGRKTR